MPIESLRNLRDTFFLKPADTINLDSQLVIDTTTIKVFAGKNLPFVFLSGNKLLIENASTYDTVYVQYRLFNEVLLQKYYHKPLSLIDSNIATPLKVYKINDTTQAGYVHFNSLDYYGTYGRSLAVGNNQDVSMNSNFNLQLNGYILDSIRIEASITDNSMPFQPDGTSYQLQEFDKIYITFEKGQHRLTAGDFNLATPKNSYFLQYNKRVQGLGIQSTQQINNNITHTIQASGSVAKGQFARNIFNGIEGNQGPYKLRGNNGEQYFIVLAGTERIYIDGQLMQRGEDRDYIINYNTAEVTFMPKQLITKDKRLQIEFEYQDRNYLNSLFQLNSTTQIGKKMHIGINAYTNQDAKNQSYMQDLDDVQKRVLRDAGDNVHNAFYKQIVPDTFDASKILYRMEQRNVNGQVFDSVFVYSTNKDSALYNLNFSNVGVQNGNYIISDAVTNGRSYTWVAPKDGIPQGEYEPVVLLISPKKHQVFSLNAKYDFNQNNSLNLELASSSYDPNLFAPNANNDHWGNAGKLTYTDLRNLSKKDSLGNAKWKVKNDFSIEYVQSNFKAIAPYRNVEFARDFNLDTTLKANELFGSFQSKLQYDVHNSLLYQFSFFDKENVLKAQRHFAQMQLGYKGFKTMLGASFTRSDGVLQQANYWRPDLLLEKNFKQLQNITIGAQYTGERNEITNKWLDRKSEKSFHFSTYSFYIKNDETQNTRLQLQYVLRNDDSVRLNQFVQNNFSKELNAQIGLYQLENHTIKFTGAYRLLNVLDSVQSNHGITNTILGRLAYNGNIGKGFIVPSIVYELGTGQEQKRAYTFVEVDAGLGMYMWVDYNQDGVQQINEFELAVYNDQKRFIKVLTPTNEYVNVQYMNLNGSLQINPAALLAAETGSWANFANRLNNQLTVQINTRAFKKEGVRVYNPFKVHALSDDDLLSNVIAVNNVFFFNRASAKFGFDYNTVYNLGKNLLTYGIEQNSLTRHAFKSRFNFLKNYTLNFNSFIGSRSFFTGISDNRAYDLKYWGVEPSLTWLLQSRVRITAAYKLEERKNEKEFGGEFANMQWITFDTKWSMKQNSSINAKVSYALIDYNGVRNTSKSFVMLDALQNGVNWLWVLNWDIRLTKGIELSLNYEGRQPGKEKTIHAGRMSVRALL